MPKRRKHLQEEGTCWEAQYIKSRVLPGKSRYGFCYGKTYQETKEKAMAAFFHVLRRMARAPARRDPGVPLVKYCTILENHVKPKLGNGYPLALRTQTVKEFKWALLDTDGLSPKTAEDVMVVLRSVVDHTAKRFPGRIPLIEFHEKSTRDCGLEGVHFHTLRHTFATRCVEVEFELKSLSEVLGHANTSIMLDRYVHSSLDLKRENMNKLVMLRPL